MNSSFFAKSKLSKLVLQEINCKKLDAPSKDNSLKVSIIVGLNFDDTMNKNGYETLYSVTIKCEENEEEKLFFLDCKVKAVYQMEGTKTNISKGFERNYNLFLREMYNTTREDINSVLNKMNVNFQMPLSLPDELQIEFSKKK